MYRLIKQDEIKKKNMQENNSDIKQFLSIQIKEKKLKDENEKFINKEQAEIWKKDEVKYKEYLQQSNQKVTTFVFFMFDC